MDFYTGNPLVGFRAWKMDEKAFLYPQIVSKEYWEPGEPLKAKCVESPYRRRKPECEPVHESPNDFCSCGFYANYKLENLNITEFQHLMCARDYYDFLVFGAILAWGKIHFHEFGFKSEYVLPIGIVDHHVMRDPKWKKVLRQVTIKYEVKMVPVHELSKYASKFGDLPDPSNYQ